MPIRNAYQVSCVGTAGRFSVKFSMLHAVRLVGPAPGRTAGAGRTPHRRSYPYPYPRPRTLEG
ncbi:hypothetical protein [Streptomyces sp. NPDC054961]